MSDSNPGSHPESVDCLPRNEPTRFAHEPWHAPFAPKSFEQLFADHYGALRHLAEEVRPTLGRPGYIAAAIHRDHDLVGLRRLAHDIGDDARSVCVIGRHSACHLQLPYDATVALRSVVAWLGPVDGERPLLRLFDLNTEHGFCVDGLAGPLRGLFADGDVCVRLGDYTVLLIALSKETLPWPPSSRDAWAQRPRPVIIEGGTDALADSLLVPRAKDSVHEMTRIGSLPGPRLVDPSLLQQPTRDTVARLVFGDEATPSAVVCLRAAQLQRGVLLGRYGRCSINTSRIWRDADVAVLIDAGSTNGTLVHDIPHQVAQLGDHAELQLAAGNRVLWSRHTPSGLVIPINMALN